MAIPTTQPAAQVQEPSKAAPPEAVVKLSPLAKAEAVPANWNLTPLEGDRIAFSNVVTNRRFEGTIEDFNKLLKG